MKRVTGRTEKTTVVGEAVHAFVPDPLPPKSPPLDPAGSWAQSLPAAQHALARLDLAGEMVPSLDWFLYAFVRKEAVLSSQIEGTQATLVDLLTFEAADGFEDPNPNVEEVCTYLVALNYAREQLDDPAGLPLSMRLLNETHRRLMSGVRGADKQPGEIRKTQNWIGGTRPGDASYVPPPPQVLPDVLRDFETFIHDQSPLPPLVRAGLLHVQFESIHPYLDGNGRIGRLLIMLLLKEWGLLSKPLLYLSLFFKRNRQEYYRRLNAVTADGDWEGWLEYFLRGVAAIADEAANSARDLFALLSEDRQKVLRESGTSVAAARLFEALPKNPIVTVAFAVRHLEVTKPTASKAIQTLESAGVLEEQTGKKRDRTWVYREYLDRLRVGTEL